MAKFMANCHMAKSEMYHYCPRPLGDSPQYRKIPHFTLEHELHSIPSEPNNSHELIRENGNQWKEGPMLHLKGRRQKTKLPGNRARLQVRSCNLCGMNFFTRAAHSCFCEDCRSNSDLYRYHDWLPEAPADLEPPQPPRAA